ncbi:uncharacterized protein UDID_17854 [Ustilago sp. UG-2017a]|nr:uncharacterized protein UDID_17854 [Ustilago sp. UG-2017a]
MPPPNHSECIESLEDQVRSLLAALNARNTQEPSNDSASARQGCRSKEPEAFTGERGHLEPFLAQVDMFLWLNPGCFINDSDQILWLSTLLRGVAHQWFYPHLSTVNPPAWLTDYPLFINQLRVVFGDPDRIATAKREIEALSQTTSVANYLTQFRQLQMTLNWGEDAMAWFFYRGLKENVKDDLSRSGKPTDLETLIQRSLEIDNRIAKRISERKRVITRSANPTPMPVSNPPIAPTTIHPSSPSALRAPLTTAGKLDPEEYKQRQANNLCIYCASSEHVVTDYSRFVTLHSLPLTSKPLTKTLLLADGKPQVIISKEVQLLCLVAELFPSDITFQVTDLGLCPIILGLPWLKGANPSIDWKSGNITMRSPPLTPSLMAPSQLSPTLPSASLDIDVIDAIAFDQSLQSDCLTSGTLYPSPVQSQHLLATTTTSADTTMALAYDAGLPNIIPQEYHQYLDVFSRVKADKLPPHRTYDHQIPLEEGKSPPFRPIYSLSEHELKTLREYLEENLAKGFISLSDSPAASPILFVKKKDGSLRLCVDYRGLNRITIRNRYPLPLIDKLLDRLREARFFTCIDLRGAYNLLCIAKGDKWKTAFHTRYGLFQYNVMPFGLTNAPASFQHLMNNTFKDMLDRSLIIYLDDLLIYSSTLKQHQEHVSAVLARLRQAGLYAKAEKCQFSTSQTEFLGFVVSDQGVAMDPSKTEVITNWPVPQSVHDVQVFLGFCNFYRKFIPQYSRTAYPLTQLLHKEAQSAPFAWHNDAQHAFEQLRSAFGTDTILRHFDPTRPIIVETDASDFAVAAVLSQTFDQGARHPIAFFSKKLDPAQLNYPIFDKEMFAIVAAFKHWRQYLEVHDVQVFLGFCNFYRKFIPQYSQTAYPLTQLLRKEAQSTPFAWNHAAQHAFEQLHSSFSTDTILHHFDPARPIIVKTDASDFAVAAVLSQSFDQGTRHPIAFFLKQLDPAQLNYPIFDKEMFAIVAAFKHWRQYLEGAKFPVQVLTDHRSLEYFTTTKQLNRRQARWSELLADFDFVIQYRPGAQAGLPDALTRRSDMRPKDRGLSLMQEHNPGNFQTLLKPHQLRLAATGILTVKSDITDKIHDALPRDPWTSSLLERVHLGSAPPGFAINSMNLLTYQDSVCVPEVDDLRLLIVQDCHNSPAAGHPGRRKTLSLVRRSFFWLGMSKFVHSFVDSCETCRRIKAVRHKPYGHLKSLLVPPHPWSSISMDLIEQLPPSSDFTAILIAVDRLTKMAIFVPTTNELDAPKLAKLFLCHVYSKHGLPTSIVSDRGSEFTSHFWHSLSTLLGIETHFSSAYHPQSDGQTERINQVLEQFLRGYSNHLQTDWSDLLPLAEFSYNNAEHASTQLTLFFANYGYHPRFSFDNTDPASPALFPTARSYAEQLKQLHEYVRGELVKANSQLAEQFDKRRLPAPQFRPGDRVWLSADNIRSLRPTKKLDYRRLGPFSVSEIISSHAYRLQLPPSMKIHNVFHVDRLEPYVANTIPNRVQLPPPHKVDHRYRDPLFYLVRWVGYGPDHNSWEPASNLTHASDLITEFHTANPTRPSPTPCKTPIISHSLNQLSQSTLSTTPSEAWWSPLPLLSISPSSSLPTVGPVRDSLPPHDLGKLHRASKSRAEPDAASGILVNGIRVQPALPSSNAPDVKRFLHQIPDVRAFAQAWTAYTALRCASTGDSDLCASLGSFLVAVVDHDTRWHWPAVAEYVLTVCEHRFGYASASDWAVDDLSAWQKALGGIPHRDVSTSKSLAKPSTAASSTDVPASSSTKRQRRDLSGQVLTLAPRAPIHWLPSRNSSISCPLSSSSSLRQTQVQHVNLLDNFRSLRQTQVQHPTRSPRQTQVRLVDTVVDDMSPRQTQVRHLTSVPAALDVPSADRCLSLLFSLCQHLPPVRPNTTLELDAFDPTTSPARIGSMQLQLLAWERHLLDYPDKRYHTQMAGMIQHGCLLGYDGPLRQANRRIANLPIDADGHAHLCREITARLAEGRLTVVPATSALVESPIGVVPKPRSVKLCTIHHLSHPRHPASSALPSVNAGINPSFVRIQYESVRQLVDFVWSNPNCLLWKGDLEDAFRHVVTAESDAYLLDFQYDGVCYRENALTFGGSSSPFLFNLVAEFLHWVVASCLPNMWPVNHYLDDTCLALLPVHALALASTALGLHLSVKKTFANLTRLEVLGIDIDSAAQTVGITSEHRAHILSQCHHLLSRGTADLLDMQCIASLLQFVSQVFPCGKAFLRRLYSCTRHWHSAGRRRIPRPALAELAWWVTMLESWSGTSVLSPSPLVVAHVWTDACPRSYGTHLGLAADTTAVFLCEVPRRHRKKNIRFLEVLAVLEALRIFAPLWSSPLTVVVHVDNENVEHGLRSSSSRDPLTQKLLREIFGFCFAHNFTLHHPVVLPPGTCRPAGQPPPTFASSMGITSAAATLLWNGLAPSTRDRAGGTVTAFRTFCAWHFGANIACLPTTGVQLLEWLGSMSSTGRSYHSAKHELGHLRSHHVDLGLSLAGFECSHLERALRSYKRVHGARRTGAKLPITLPLLRHLVAAVDTFGNLSARDRAVFKAVFTLSFACFLRSGEVIWDRCTDPAVVLRVGSVELAADHAVVTLPVSKTDPFRLGVKVVTPLVGGPECPIAHLCRLLSGRPSSAPLFGLGPSGADPLPRSSFVAILRRAIAFTGLAPSAYAGHSFQCGATTWAARLGASPETIQCLGCWNSDCFRRYVDHSAGEHRDLSVATLFSVRDGPLVPNSASWQDVGAT